MERRSNRGRNWRRVPRSPLYGCFDQTHAARDSFKKYPSALDSLELTSMFRTTIRSFPFSTQKKPPVCKLRFSIRLLTTTSTNMAPIKSWLAIPPESDFSLSNIPFGIITSRNSRDQKRPAVAIGDHVLDLLAFSQAKGFSGLPSIEKHIDVFAQPSLNAFAALGRPVHKEVRAYLQEVFSESGKHASVLKDNEELKKNALLKKEDTKTHLPMQIGDYTDFFAGINHAFNVGYVLDQQCNSIL